MCVSDFSQFYSPDFLVRLFPHIKNFITAHHQSSECNVCKMNAFSCKQTIIVGGETILNTSVWWELSLFVSLYPGN